MVFKNFHEVRKRFSSDVKIILYSRFYIFICMHVQSMLIKKLISDILTLIFFILQAFSLQLETLRFHAKCMQTEHF